MIEENKDKDESYLKYVLRKLKREPALPPLSPEEELKQYDTYQNAFAKGYGQEKGKQQARIEAVEKTMKMQATLEKIKTEEKVKRKRIPSRGPSRVEWTEQGYGTPFPEEYTY